MGHFTCSIFVRMGQAVSLPVKLSSATMTFYRGFFHYLIGAGRHSPYLTNSPHYLMPSSTSTNSLFYQHARVHLFTLASEFYLYHRPHYRKPSYRQDLLDNFSNVAIPGTGLSLRHVVRNRLFALGFLCTAYPAISLVASVHQWLRSGLVASLSQEYATRLLAPDDWFSYWRLNSRVAALHALLNHVPPGYHMENKWTFLQNGLRQGVPVSPILTSPAIVVKHRNEEGGMGIHFYKNATQGGDWIIQERIENGDWVSRHLPPNAPLSTFRVITLSRGALEVDKANAGETSIDAVTALSCVFRAGRNNALTDHDAIMFDVDIHTGQVLGGTTTAHWYQLGWDKTLPGRCHWRTDDHAITHHPDGNIPVSGSVVPNIQEMLRLVEKSHHILCPDVPFVGWDVVMSADEKLPLCLLEVNLSCNFFRGSFDRKVYLDFVEDMLTNLQAKRLVADKECQTFK